MKTQDFKEKLIEARQAQGLTQEDVAKICNISARTIQRIESGNVLPRPYTIKSISDNLGIDFFETSKDSVEQQQPDGKKKSLAGYIKELFNFKTNTLKKISILATPFVLVGFMLFIILTSQAKDKIIYNSSSLNNYSFDLYRHTKIEKENLLLSPLNTYYSLLAAYDGSKKKTKLEFEKVFHLQNPGDPYKKDLNEVANKSDSSSGLYFSNAVWLDKSIVVEGEYSNTVSEKYFTDFEQTDFSKTKQAVLEINNWVDKKTNHKISNIVSDFDIDQSTRLVISNAVYFKGDWLMKFDKQNTRSAAFFTSVEDQYQVDFMNMTESLQYYENDMFQFVTKDYRNSPYSFCILLPKKIFGIEDIEQIMNADFFDQLLDSTSYVKTKISIPKLKLESGHELSDVLKRLGLKTAFTSEADFSGITKETPLQFTKVLHKTAIELGESYTEAAATTTAIQRITGLPSYKVFKADHPFVFFIIDQDTKAIVFMGRYVKPSNSEKIESDSLIFNLAKRKQEKFAIGEAQEILILIDNEYATMSEFQNIDPDAVESVNIFNEQKDIAKYTKKLYDGVIVVTLKKRTNR